MPPHSSLRLKVEINTREHFSVLGLVQRPFEVNSRWFQGRVLVPTYTLEELLGTKLRALYQRSAGRDVFDLDRALDLDPSPDIDMIVRCFHAYISHQGVSVSRLDFERNLADKRADAGFLTDMLALVSTSAPLYDSQASLDLVLREIVTRLP